MSDADAPALMTLALSTWNHERYVEQAVLAALAQDYTPLEIIISDDASADGTYAIVQRMAAAYRGPHTIRLNRNPRNLGVGAHNDLLMQMAQGEMVILSAGDDIDEPDRVSSIAAICQTNSDNILCVASQALTIDETGKEGAVIAPWTLGPNVSLAELAQSGEALLGATLAVHKKLLARFGALGSGIRTCEDIVLPFRAALMGQVKILQRPLVRYRRHSGSLMGTTTPIAADPEIFVNGMRRMFAGMLAARRRQMADLELSSATLDASQFESYRGYLTGHLVRSEIAVNLLRRKPLAWCELINAVRTGIVSFVAAVKMVMMTKAPKLWFHYIRLRAGKAISRNDQA